MTAVEFIPTDGCQLYATVSVMSDVHLVATRNISWTSNDFHPNVHAFDTKVCGIQEDMPIK